ncbi:MAG: diguanylate cyclase, partial [Steroidobacteraceae bacterium]|nr:diguanylate cyclase [Steroidobacteraceae bacterium]MDW8258626.1 diguanylate cyclase [Gammaproteobacteria bacterium]
MTARSRKVKLFLLAGLLFLAGVAVLVKYVLLASFARLEQDAVRQSTTQVQRALAAEVGKIALVGNDYANWDEAYEFVRTRHPRFAETNFSEPGLRELNINVVYLIDENGNEIFSAEQYAEGQRYHVPATPATLQAIRARLSQITARARRETGANLIDLPGGIAIFTAHRIMPTSRRGPDRGTLVFVRQFGDELAAALAETSQLPVLWWDTRRPVSAAIPPAIVSWARSPQPGASIRTHIDGEDRICGFVAISDLDGHPALVIGTHTRRDVFNAGLQTANYLMWAIVTLVVLVLAAVYVLDSRLERSSRLARDNQLLYQAVVEQADEAIVLLNPETQEILQANPALARLTGRTVAELRARTMEDLLDPSCVPLYWTLLETSGGGAGRPPLEMQLIGADGSRVAVEIAANSLVLHDRRIVCLLIRDLSARRKAETLLADRERKLEHLANHDPVTGLPNRVYLNYRLPSLAEETARANKTLLALHIDIDNFKTVNDVAGHEAGDEFLIAVAERIRGAVAQDDLVARISGDEFVVLARVKNGTAVQPIAKRIAERLREPLSV